MLDFKKSQNLGSYNTFGFDVEAKLFIEIHSTEDLKKLLQTKEWKDNKRLILGGGSNVLLSDDFDGLVIKNSIKGIDLDNEDSDSVTLSVGGGENWHDFVLFTIENNWGGLENLSLIPGTVGAAPMQNIGAYGVEIKDSFKSLNAVDLNTGTEKKFDQKACQFGYRESVFKHKLKNQFLITSVQFRLDKAPHTLNLDYGIIKNVLAEKKIDNPTIKDVSDAVIHIRQSKLPDPSELGNSGSFFKNPIVSKKLLNELEAAYPDIPNYKLDDENYKLAAGWLIDQLGWKGYQENGVGVHDKQALVLVNHGNGSGAAIKKLAQKIQDSVHDKFKVKLNPEVNFI